MRRFIVFILFLISSVGCSIFNERQPANSSDEHYSRLENGRIVGPAYSRQKCASQTVGVFCNEFDAIKELKKQKKSGSFNRVTLESKIIDTDESRKYGCDMNQADAYFVYGTICE